ncbi:hypothetical protein FD45_GL001499 [Liquorilactobacillus nagelii DSM 13675]|nr:hypothetical protein FD45_GL001499 [Liquorilactobacillus nagelii DSM 13675]
MENLKQTLPDFLANGIEQLDFDGDIQLTWNEAKRTFNLELTFFAQNNLHDAIFDLTGVESDEPIVTFVDAVLIYDQNSFKPDQVANDYLACLPFAGKQGWSTAMGRAFFRYLQIVLDNGESDLLDFLNDQEVAVFELEWSPNEFEKILQQYQQESDQRLPYPE